MEDPGRILAKFLTRVGKDDVDIKSHFPTSEVVRAQLFHRYMERLGVDQAGKFADDFAKCMISFQRLSRQEAVQSFQAARKQQMIAAGLMPEEEEE